jgi:GT2 family glycosyltransferase/glycosyltransferase involved in cell wall biosynthesis
VAEADFSPPHALERAQPGETVGLGRGAAAVCIPLYGQQDLFAQCLQSVLAHTSSDVLILVADDASPDPASERFLEELTASGTLHHRVVYLRQPLNVGFVANVNAAFGVLTPADVVILNSDVVVGPEWLERMRDAAYSDTNIATASALTNHGTILSVPERNNPMPRLPDGTDAETAARAVAETSPRLRPRIPTAIGHCMYIRRDAIELVGKFDEAFSPGYGEEVDFSQRCIARGLSNVAADDVFVFHRGAGSFRSTVLRDEHETIIQSRYPFYVDTVRAAARERTGPLPRALSSARAAIKPLSVTIDARFLGRTITGTQVQALELIYALWRTKKADLRIVVPSALEDWNRSVLDGLSGVEYVEEAKFLKDGANLPRTDVVHRLSQVFSWPDLALIPRLGDRFVITHLDLIAYRNPAYSSTYAEWHEYQRLTRLTLALADCVVFMSEHPARDAIAEELVDERRARVVHLGVDHQLSIAAVGRRPKRLPESADSNFVLCIGTNFRHKNRVFALRMLEALQRRHGWGGWLVFAGPHAAAGTSAGDEAEFLSARPDVAARVADLQAVGNDEKLWLFREAKGVLFPSTYEGFGLVPFEAAEQGTPCFHAHQTSLRDILPKESTTLVPWDAAESADAIVPALRDGEAARGLVELVLHAGRELTWTRAANAMLDVYAGVIRVPNREVARLADVSVPVSLRALTSAKSEDFSDLPPDAYRAVYALATHHKTRGPFLRMVRALYATAYFLRLGRRPPVEETL